MSEASPTSTAVTNTNNTSNNNNTDNSASSPHSSPPSPPPSLPAATSGDSTTTISLTLLLISGARTTFTFFPSDTIETVKTKVFDAWPKEWSDEPRPTSPQSLKILYLGKFLADGSTLESNKIQPGTTTIVHLTIKAPEPDMITTGGHSKSDSAARCRSSMIL
ncbi:hypothetical protein BG004_007826, partial [Podila humilis]